MSAATNTVSIGIDVSKANLDIGVLPSGEAWTTANRDDDITSLVKMVRKLRPETIIVEPTAGLERNVVSALAQAGLPVAVVNPRQVRDFARASGILAKTDRLDAIVLARFGQALVPEVRTLKDDETQALTDLLTRRRQLADMRTTEKIRLSNAPAVVKKNIKAHIDWLTEQIKDQDQDLDDLLHASVLWCENDKLLQSVPGVGRMLSLSLLSMLP